MNPVPDPADGLPTRAALARELLRYKMEDYSENGFCASWQVNLEFELWEAADRDSPSGRDMFTVNTSRECRLLATGSTRAPACCLWLPRRRPAVPAFPRGFRRGRRKQHARARVLPKILASANHHCAPD